MRFSTLSMFVAVALSTIVSINEGVASPASDATLPSTQLLAVVVFPDGTPAPGAVVLTSAGGSAVADSEGRVRLEFAATTEPAEVVVTAATTRDGATLSGSARFDGHGREAFDLGRIVLDAETPCEPDWLSTLGGAPGVNGSVRAIAFYDDGSGAGPQLYVAGQFSLAGSTPVSNIAKWDGHEWRPLGAGAEGPNSIVYALAVYRASPDEPEYLYAGGLFTLDVQYSPRNIARWDGQSWSRVWHQSPDSAVFALRVHDDGNGPALYAGGHFLNFGNGIPPGSLAKWNGVSWSRLSGGPHGSPVYAIESFRGGNGASPALYIGGLFERVGSTVVNNVAGWNGSWFALGEGTNGPVRALKVFDDGQGGGPQVYAGGEFIAAGGNPVNRLARWDGEQWLALDTGVNGTVEAMAVYRHPTTGAPALYIGGDFTSAGGENAQRLARWDAPNLVPVMQAFDARVYALHASGDPSDPDARLVAGGNFFGAQGLSARGVASWDTQSWRAFGTGFPAPVHALQRFGGSLIVAGSFREAGGIVVNSITAWDGANWRPLSSGTDGSVFAMTVFDPGENATPSLIVGGNFTRAGSWGSQRIARWDGQNWVPMGLGMTNAVRALAVFDDGLGGGPTVYAAGEFVVAGGAPANRIARWNGTNWVPVGDGFNSTVNALTVYKDPLTKRAHLYAGGRFSQSGSTPLGGIAKWDGAAWTPVGGGLTSPSGPEVYAFSTYDDGLGDGLALIAGGSFDRAGGLFVGGIARWDGVEWRALSSFDGTVYALENFSDGVQERRALAAAGSFNLGGVSSTLALWNGVSWTPIDDEPVFPIRALAHYGGPYGARHSLYLGGNFPTSPAGDSYLTRWQGCERDTPCPGDTDADGLVNFVDLNAVLSTFGQTGDALPGDVNADGVVNFADLNTVILNMGLACP